jgi:hypothetical protein
MIKTASSIHAWGSLLSAGTPIINQTICTNLPFDHARPIAISPLSRTTTKSQITLNILLMSLLSSSSQSNLKIISNFPTEKISDTSTTRLREITRLLEKTSLTKTQTALFRSKIGSSANWSINLTLRRREGPNPMKAHIKLLFLPRTQMLNPIEWILPCDHRELSSN